MRLGPWGEEEEALETVHHLEALLAALGVPVEGEASPGGQEEAPACMLDPGGVGALAQGEDPCM